MTNKNYSDWTKEELIKELEKVKKQKKYGLVWEDKPENVALLCKSKLPVLKEVKDKEIKTDESKPTNILIEGDNYHALSVLNYTHQGKIDVIYIDPPYNLGNGDFTYNDKIVDKEDAYRHSKWLSSMEKRLKLAKDLLSDTGVIFISVDDTEMAQLKLLCDEIFGEKNFEPFIWKKKGGAGNTEKIIGKLTEYILCYFKNKKEGVFNYRDIDRVYKYKDELGLYNLINIEKTNLGRYERETMRFPIVDPVTGKTFLPAKNMRWTLGEKSIKEAIEQGNLFFNYEKNKVYYKKRPIEDETAQIVFYNLLLDYGSLKEAKKELADFFGNAEVFDTPKPTRLIIHLLEIASKPNSIILDFFAGSGTTGHAVLALNKVDNGNRKFILCTNNENNICTNICYPRLSKVINGYTNPKKEKIEGLGGNLKYFKTSFVDADPTDMNKKELVDQSTEMLCLKEACFDLVFEDENYRIFKNNDDKYLGIIYRHFGIEPFKKKVRELKKKFVVYVFSLDSCAREEEFEDMFNMVELRTIPEAILNVYRRIFE